MTDTRHEPYNRRKEDRYKMWERHVSTIILTLLLGLMVWVGNSLTENIETTARTDVRLANIEGDIQDLKEELGAKMADRFTGSQAKRMMDMYEKRFDALEKWSTSTEKRLDKIEIHHDRMVPK